MENQSNLSAGYMAKINHILAVLLSELSQFFHDYTQCIAVAVTAKNNSIKLVVLYTIIYDERYKRDIIFDAPIYKKLRRLLVMI